MKYLLNFLLIIFLCPSLQLQAAARDNQFITVTLPETVIQDSIQQILPLTLDLDSDQVEGTITIKKIESLTLENQRLSAQIELYGTDLVIKTVVANQEIHMQLGTASADFTCDAALRYDTEQQILYIRPKPHDLQPEQNIKKGDIGEALLLLLNGREFPIELKDLQPIIAETAGQTIIIQTRVADIQSTPQYLELKLAPTISTERR